MSEAKHTPGPWGWGGECKTALTFDREGCVYPPSHELTGGYQYGGPIAVVSIDEDAGHEANGRLIAAAPDLLAACEEWLDADSPHTSLAEQRWRWDGIMARMREAVAKAKGV